MSPWYTSNLGDAMLAGEALAAIKARCLEACEQGHCPTGMAVFFRHESEGRLHCEVKVFFSPAAAALATGLDATACPRPARDGLGLLAGSEDAWSALFPDPQP